MHHVCVRILESFSDPKTPTCVSLFLNGVLLASKALLRRINDCAAIIVDKRPCKPHVETFIDPCQSGCTHSVAFCYLFQSRVSST